VLHADARQLPLADASVDLVLTDPPYFDNIPYSELSDFFAPWLAMLGVIDNAGPVAWAHSLSAPDREPQSIDRFAVGLHACFAEIARVLRPDGRLIFTFQHSTAGAWSGLAQALAPVPLKPIQVLPLLGNGKVGLHVHEGASTWDAVFVVRRSSDVSNTTHGVPALADAGHLQAAVAHAAVWERRIQAQLPGRFGHADRMSFRRACLVAASVGFLWPPTAAGPSVLLEEALTTAAVGVDDQDQMESATRPGSVRARAEG
jgi:putative DNA methylase